MALVQHDGIVRDFLSRSAVPCGRGYRRVAVRKTGAVDMSPSPTTRLFFPCAARPYMVVSGPLGAVRIGLALAMILLAVSGKPDGFVVDYLALSESVWPDPDLMPDGWRDVLKVHVCKVRRLLQRVGSEMTITTVWGRGVAMHRTAIMAANDDTHLKQVSNA
ncbi:helix-turn-helix domain-containing protein [Thalassospira sp.]|uniref:helix-turn-helix domain-containing protein n=1 Tax=Thalassospira sp. TaxID=1912094 RepID=UPI003AA7E8B8